uniref:Ubiquitin carboxyl-terminal hydrolase n=1 Tax=Globisporangium ultimum (strain ATCC 200006 / CBS 805.95 / DAOM BR144) TaxID=431595 RepID=K3WN15_GLOUD
MSDDSDSGKRWFPLESNPAVMNTYVEQMGFPTAEFSFCDVLSIEDWALEMVPTPVLGVLMLFPIKAHTEAFAKEEEEKILRDGQVVSDSVYYMRQTVGNACGTIGILHAIGNTRQHITLDPSSYLGKLFNKTETKTPDEIADFLENDNELEETHSSAADAGQSEQLESVDDPINTHFICFSHVDGHLYELDGRKKFPINHGPTTQDNLLKDACAVIQKFMTRDEGEVRFTILALAKTRADDDDA